jgi:hypothetical protein
MSVHGIARRATVNGVATPTTAPVYVDSDDNKLKMIPAGSGTTEIDLVDVSSTQTLTNKTLTSPVVTGQTGSLTSPAITSPAITGSPTSTITLSSITTATAAPAVAASGTTYVFNRATGIAVTLPLEASSTGVWYRFVIGTNFTANGTIAPVGTNTMRGMVTAADGAATASSAAADLVTFINTADVVGDWVEVYCDGTNWYLSGMVAASAGVTFA